MFRVFGFLWACGSFFAIPYVSIDFSLIALCLINKGFSELLDDFRVYYGSSALSSGSFSDECVF